MRVDFSKRKSFDPIPAGVYHVMVTNAEPTTSKAGNEMIKWTLTVQNEGEYQGRNVWLNTVNTDNAAWKLAEFLEACTGAEVPNGEVDVNPADYLNAELIVTVELEKAQNSDTKMVNSVADCGRYIPERKSRR